MNKTAVKNFAVWARNKLIEEITYKAGLLGVNENGIAPELPTSTDTLKLYDIGTKEPAKVEGIAIIQRNSLVNAVNSKAEALNYKEAFQFVIEEVAYTWFNRLIAVRFMEVNGYLPSGVRVLSSEKANKNEPDMVTNPFDTDIEFTEKDRKYMATLRDDELFRFLFIKQCNALHDILPDLFEKTADYSEILLTLSFTDTDSVVYHLVHDIPEEDFNIEKEGQVQIIGWLYQYYNTEPKDKVFAALKKNVKISKENIPAATQLFTPDWIVRYMVENSLGRLWADGHKDFDRSEWKYYLEEAEQEESIKAKLSEIRAEYKNTTPEEIRFCDPCMGSGHILVYAFDVLMQIYLSQGYSERDAAAKIIRNNLYGLDIDKRAYQLAYFAIKMKAVEYDSRFLKRKETKHLEPNLSHFQGLDGVQNAVVGGALKEFAEQFKNCETYGSLMEISEVKGLDEALDNFSGVLDMSFEQVEQMMRIYTVLSQKYDVVCTNPPYMGSDSMNSLLKSFVSKYYPDCRYDLYACFIRKCIRLLKVRGFTSLITQHSYLYAYCFREFRKQMLNSISYVNAIHLGARAFEEISGEVVQCISFVLQNIKIENYAQFIPLSDASKDKMNYFFEAPRMKIRTSDFKHYNDYVFAYSMTDSMKQIYLANKKVGDYFASKAGVVTGNDNYFLRYWYEINCLYFNCKNASIKSKYVPFSKGGTFVKWYGNVNYALKIADLYDETKVNKSVRKGDKDAYFKQCVGWSQMGGGNEKRFSILENCVCGTSSPTIISNKTDLLLYSLGFLNTKITSPYIKCFNPLLSTYISDICNLPFIISDFEKVVAIVQENISLSRADWDSFETSWDFKTHPLVRCKSFSQEEVKVDADHQITDMNYVREAFTNWSNECYLRFNQLKSNEEELNHIFIDIYDLQDELTPEVEDKDVTVRKADLQREIKSLISYAVGCMFGRYSLDKEGLVYAGGNFDAVYTRWIATFGDRANEFIDENGELVDGGFAGCRSLDYDGIRKNGKWCKATFAPDKDNCIPITDEEYFSNDIVTRFAEFIKVVYGENTLEENLDFIADALGTKGNTSRQKIRTYFLNDFIKDHIKIYQKRPIYWLFDSGKQNGFKALVYMHRWNADMTGNVRVEYLHKLQRVYESEINRMQDTIDNTSDNREKALAEKRRDKLSKQLKEARDYDEKLTHLALSRIDIDLDDGVKVNYEKVQTAKDGRKLEILTPIK